MMADKAIAAARRAHLLSRKSKPKEVQPCEITAPAAVESCGQGNVTESEAFVPLSIDIVATVAPAPTPAPRPRLVIEPAAIARARFQVDAGAVEATHLLHVLLATALATEVDKPICIVLPSTDQVSETVGLMAAIECLAVDLEGTRPAFREGLRPGKRVRLGPGGEVFELDAVNADGSLRLRMMDKATYKSNGTRYASADRAFWFEPTTRHQPLGTQHTKFVAPQPNQLDMLLGSQLFANTGLVRTRVILAGMRKSFHRTLASLPLVSVEGPALMPVRRVLPFGGLDAAGKAYVIEPSGSAGQPMIAIERELLDLERACLAEDIEPGSRLVLTDRLDMVLRDLSLAGRIAERQRLILFVEARRRSEIAFLADKGWVVWEPTAHEIIGAGPSEIRMGSSGIDASLRAAAGETLRTPGFISCKSHTLRRADAALAHLGLRLGDESVEEEEWVEDLLSGAQNLFFSCANWLTVPEDAELDSAVAAADAIRRAADRIGTRLGPEGAGAAVEFADAVDNFRALAVGGSLTAKGGELLRLARTASESTYRQIFVTGNRQSRERADAFFRRHDLETRCVAVRELAQEGDRASIVGFSVMRRDLFERLVDPWPSANTLFLGYEFETDCYRRRLGRRDALRRAMRLDVKARTKLTSIAGARFPEPRYEASMQPLAPADIDHLDGFDRATREWSWVRRITIPAPSRGEETCEARIVRFAGRSWSAMTAEHEITLLVPSDGGQTYVREAHTADLAPETRIVVREGGDRDVIRLLAQDIKGEKGYEALRQHSSLWRRVLQAASVDHSAIHRRLELVGVRRHPATVRAWLHNAALIGPRSVDDVEAIARAFPDQTIRPAAWKACTDAIAELRALHQTAGAKLTDLLSRRCGKMLLEPSDTELAIDLGIGTVWVLEVAGVEDEARECPASYVNRLHWQDPVWKSGLLTSQLRARAA
ncbi:hypothetical protein [Lichenibacterium dinghuense]|uniref:hypothetical protein n=1 Tax=Lichenibacterium dinghuense TaxID=2895977 RepID=UPI001F22451C|nr:hypothetical protein [Lichenibacterium sp. 6Y81]